MSNTQRDNPENTTAEVKPIEAPAGVDLHPKPKTSVTVSKRAGAAVGVIALGLLLAFAYGGYRRQVHAQASAHGASIPKSLLPATASASEVEKEIPSGNAPLVHKLITDPNIQMEANERAASHSGLNRKSATALGRGIKVQNGLADLEDEPVCQIERAYIIDHPVQCLGSDRLSPPLELTGRYPWSCGRSRF